MVRSLWKEVALVGCVAAAGTVFGTSGSVFGAGDLSATPGVVSNIKIMSDKNPDDMTSAETWKKAYIKEGMSDQDKAIAVWRTVTKYRHQDNPPNEGIESTGNVHEPFKTFNVYGYGMCCCAAADIEGLNRYIGLPARGRIINNHSVPEVWYESSWHLFDASLTFFLQKPDAEGKLGQGLVASVDEMKADIMAWRKLHPELKNDSDVMKFAKDEGWKNNGPTLFATANLSPTGALYHFYSKDGWCRAEAPGTGQGTTNHGWNSNMAEYNYKHPDDKAKMLVVPPDTTPAWNVYDYGAIMGYQVNVELREGEKLTRCWFADEAATGLNRNNPKRYQKFLEGDMTGLSLQKDLGDLAPGRIGNGTLEYDAMADSKLSRDAIAFENLTMDGNKIRIVDATKPATLIVRMPCSYLYLNGEMTSNPVVSAGGSVKASISVNNGVDWKDLATFDKPGEQKTDLKPLVYNKYDYRVKLEFAGAGTGLDGLKLVNKVQHSQAPLPLITEGENKLTFTAAPAAEGTVTVQGNMNPEPRETKEDVGTPVKMADFHPTLDGLDMNSFRVGNTGKGTAIVPITTPGEITRLRLGVHWRARDPKDGYTITASFDNGQTWKDVGKLDLANPAKSTYIVFSDVPAGSKAVQVKFDGTQHNTAAIFDLRIDADYKEPAGGFRPVKVTYAWEEGVPQAKAAATAAAAALKGKEKAAALAAVDKVHGTPKTDVHVCASPTESWTITCAPGMKPVSYTVELAK